MADIDHFSPYLGLDPFVMRLLSSNISTRNLRKITKRFIKGIRMACGTLLADSKRESYPRTVKSPAGWRRRRIAKPVNSTLKNEGADPEKTAAGGGVWWQGA